MIHKLRCLNPVIVLKMVRNYGFEISVSKYISQMICMSLLMYGFGRLMGLTGMYLWCLLVVVGITIPLQIHNLCRSKYEESRFVDISNYIEQLLYSFKRHSKIINALEEASIIFPEGEMGQTIEKALNHIQELSAGGYSYEEALGFIVERYDCEIVRRVHKFIISVELFGGNHKEATELLIEDRNKWVNRTVEAQKSKIQLKRNMTLAVIFSIGIILSTRLMIPLEFSDIATSTLAQVTTLMILIMNYSIWIYVQYKLSGSFIENKGGLRDDIIGKYYQLISKSNKIEKRRMYFIIAVSFIVTVFIIYTKNFLILLWWCLLFALIISNHKRRYNIALKKIKREVNKAFPEWLLGVSLRLQQENVHIALAKSVEEAPYVMQGELIVLINSLEEDPLSIKPYMKFFEALELVELQSAMKMLYAMSQYGNSEVMEQVGTLVERNSKLQDKSEQLKMEDYLAGMSFFVLLPMLFGSIKLLVDMMLLIVNLLSRAAGMA